MELSIIVPTFNNLTYLKCLIESIKENSIYNHELVIHINEGSDGTLNYIKENNKYIMWDKDGTDELRISSQNGMLKFASGSTAHLTNLMTISHSQGSSFVGIGTGVAAEILMSKYP